MAFSSTTKWTSTRYFKNVHYHQQSLLCIVRDTAILSLLQFLWPLRQPFPSVLWHCWLGDRKGIRPVKTECWFVGCDIGLELCMSYSFSCLPSSLASINWLTQVHLEKWPLKWRELTIISDTPFSTLTLLVGRQEGHLACKSWVLVCWWHLTGALHVLYLQLSPPLPSSLASINTD